jgi:predicted nucleic acid-binding protein
MKIKRWFADTNLFLRYLTNDIPEQADAVEGVLRQAIKGEISLTTNSLAIAEIVWTLESFYHLPPADIQAKVLAILNTPGLTVVEGELVLQAILLYAEKNVDYIDAYNAVWLLNQGIDTVCSFDRKHFSRFAGVTVVRPGEDEA